MRVSHRLALQALWIATALRVLLPSAADPDLWGHVLFGDLFLHGGIASTNGFAYTAPAYPWINHELLAEAAMAALYAILGSRGLVLLKVTLGLTTLALVRHAALRRCHSAWAATIATAVVAVIMTPGFMIRPQLFTLVGVALVLELLGRARYQPRGAAWMLPIVIAIWINFHGGVLAGVGLAAIGLAAGAWRARPSPATATTSSLGATATTPSLRRAELVRATALIALLLAATLVNVYGVKLPWFLVTKVTPRVAISEWAPVTLADMSFPAFKVAVLAIAGWAALVDVAALLRLRRRQQGCARVLRGGIAAMTVVQVALAILVAAQTQGRIDVDPNLYPVQALRFLAQNDIVGRVALPFDWGEVALWSLPAGSSVAVDGRFTTAYPQYVLDESWRFMSGDAGWNALLTRYPTDVVMSARSQPPAQLLRDDPEWTYVYSDPIAVVFLRRSPSHAAALARFHAGRFAYDSTPLDAAFPALARGARDAPSSATLAAAWIGP